MQIAVDSIFKLLLFVRHVTIVVLCTRLILNLKLFVY